MPASRASILLALGLLGAWPAGALELGTLFHTPEERTRLDRLRRGEPEQPRSTTTISPQERTTAPALTGFVQRSDGKNTIWLDGRPVPTHNPRAAPLFDPRKVQDDSPPLPPDAVKPTPPPPPPAKR